MSTSTLNSVYLSFFLSSSKAPLWYGTLLPAHASTPSMCGLSAFATPRPFLAYSGAPLWYVLLLHRLAGCFSLCLFIYRTNLWLYAIFASRLYLLSCFPLCRLRQIPFCAASFPSRGRGVSFYLYLHFYFHLPQLHFICSSPSPVCTVFSMFANFPYTLIPLFPRLDTWCLPLHPLMTN